MKKFSKNDINKYVKTITAYTLPYGFIIEADKCEEVTDFYIYHKDYSVKMLMFTPLFCLIFLQLDPLWILLPLMPMTGLTIHE